MSNIPIVIKDGNATAKSLLAQDNGDGTITFYHLENTAQRTALLAALAGLPTSVGATTMAGSLSIAPATDATFKEDSTQRAALLAALAGLPTTIGAGTSAASLSITPATDASFKEDATQRATLLAALAGLPITLGTKVSANSTSITPASDSIFSTSNVMLASNITPLTGTTDTNMLVGPFAPALGRPIIVTLSGTWTGTAQMLRSIDAGTTQLPITSAGNVIGSYTGNCNEPVISETEYGAVYYLNITMSSGSLNYRIAQ